MKHLQISVWILAALMMNACSDAPTTALTPSSPTALGSSTELTQVRVVPSDVRSAAPAPDNAAANFEIRFLTNMIDHHQMAVEMAMVCVEKAIHEELRALCNDIITSQTQEIETMQAWLQDWYGIMYEPVMKPGDMKMLERLHALSDAEFEIEFMEMMIRHHERAIREAEKCLGKAYHPELDSLCTSIIEAQSAEIAQMEAWLCQWYGRC